MISRIVTIGVYGFTEEQFFNALREARVDTFCDIRWRRGVRGSDYVFANSARLQKRLGDMNITYVHFRNLAPSPALRRRQVEADKTLHIAKRQRTELSDSFVEAYRQEHLAGFSGRQFASALGDSAGIVALFCVERDPKACHRSLLAEQLQQDLGISVEHLRPNPGP